MNTDKIEKIWLILLKTRANNQIKFALLTNIYNKNDEKFKNKMKCLSKFFHFKANIKSEIQLVRNFILINVDVFYVLELYALLMIVYIFIMMRRNQNKMKNKRKERKKENPKHLTS